MFNKRDLGRFPRKENGFNQDQKNGTSSSQLSVVVQVTYIYPA